MEFKRKHEVRDHLLRDMVEMVRRHEAMILHGLYCPDCAADTLSRAWLAAAEMSEDYFLEAIWDRLLGARDA